MKNKYKYVYIALLVVVASVSGWFLHLLLLQDNITNESELLGMWSAVDGGIDVEIEFNIDEGERVFNSYQIADHDAPSSRDFARSLSPSMIRVPWKYDSSGLIIGERETALHFDEVVIRADGTLKLANSKNHGLDGVYLQDK